MLYIHFHQKQMKIIWIKYSTGYEAAFVFRKINIMLVYFFWFFSPLENLPVKRFKFWPMVVTHVRWAVRVFLACHTYFDTGPPFIMVISEDPRHSHLLSSVWQLSCHFLFLQLRSVAANNRTERDVYVISILIITVFT